MLTANLGGGHLPPPKSVKDANQIEGRKFRRSSPQLVNRAGGPLLRLIGLAAV